MYAKKQLLKTILKVALGYFVMYLFCTVSGSVSGSDRVLCMIGSGVVLGWEWASHIITATSLYGIAIKFFLAFILGLPALPIVLGRDIIAFIRECRGDLK